MSKLIIVVEYMFAILSILALCGKVVAFFIKDKAEDLSRYFDNKNDKGHLGKTRQSIHDYGVKHTSM
jgi:hypothetical protein